MVAVIRRYQPQVSANVPRPTPVQASTTSVTALGEGLNDLANTAQVWQDEIDTSVAMEVDAKYSDFIREQLYGENGFMYLDGANAITQRESLTQRLEEQYTNSFEGLTVGARRKAERALQARRQQALQNADSHAAGEIKTYRENAVAARSASEVLNAIYDPDVRDQSITNITNMERDLGAKRGEDPAVTQLRIDQKVAAIHMGIATRLMTADPGRAQQYLSENREAMKADPTFPAFERNVITASRERNGQIRAQRDYILSKTSTAANASLAALEAATGLTLKITSGHRTKEQNAAVGGADGSQHLHGNAFDVDVRGMSTEERTALIIAARQAGFGGIGIYANSLHFDVGPQRAWGPSYHNDTVPDWAQDALQTPVGAAGEGAVAATDVASMDPTEAEAYMTTWSRMATHEANTRKVEQMQAYEQLYTQIVEWANPESGVPPDPLSSPMNSLTSEQMEALGADGIAALRQFEGSLAAGTPPVTTPQGQKVFDEAQFLIHQVASGMPGRNPSTGLTLDEARQVLRDADPYVEWLNIMDPAKYARLTAARAEALTPSPDKEAMKPIPLNTIEADFAGRFAALAGTDKKKEEAYKNVFRSRMIEWQQANPDLARDAEATNKYATYLSTKIHLYAGSNREGMGMEFDMGQVLYKANGDPVFAQRTPQTDDDLTVEQIDEQIAGGNLYLDFGTGKIKVEPSIAAAVYADLLRLTGGRAPLPGEFMQALIARYAP